MKFAEKQLIIRDEVCIMNSLRSLFWNRESALIVSDLHIGKSAHFRKNGIPVTSDIQKDDLERLSYLVSYYNSKKLIVVGDLFHAQVNSDFDFFDSWRTQHKSLKIHLIKGNHDRLKPHIYERFDLLCCKYQLEIQPLTFVHEPDYKSENFTISGHIHPGVSVKGTSGPRIKLPCFYKTETQLILPAFSEFTGLNVFETKSKSKSYAFTKTNFFEF